jgi:hypothetical protein
MPSIAALRPRSSPRALVAFLGAVVVAGCSPFEPVRYAGVGLSATSLRTVEGGANGSVDVTLTGPPTATVAVDLASSNTAEGLLLEPGGSTPGQQVRLTFTAADWNVPQAVQVVPQDDAIPELDVAYTVTASVAWSNDTAYLDAAGATLQITNGDDDVVVPDPDAATFTVSTTTLDTSEGGPYTTFSVVLDSAPAADVVIPIASSNAAEGLLSGGDSGGSYVASLNLTFTPGDWSTIQWVRVMGPTDGLDDGRQAYRIAVGPTSSTSAAHDALAAKAISAENWDVDTAGFSIQPQYNLLTSEGGGTDLLYVRLDTIPTETVTVPVRVSDPTEALVSAGGEAAEAVYLIFTPAGWNTWQTVTVHGVDDLEVDGQVAYTVQVGPTSSIDPDYAALPAKVATGKNSDDDA